MSFKFNPLTGNFDIAAIQEGSGGGGTDEIVEVLNYSSLPVVGQAGLIYITIDTDLVYRWTGSTYTEISPSAVKSVNGQTGIVVLDKSSVGLSNVDNTSDLDKPIGTATQDALDLKQDTLSFTPENITNKSTDTSLGTSDILYPTQNAVKTYVDSVVVSGAPDATSTTKGILKLTGDLGGTAEFPTVPGLDTKYDISNPEGYISLADLPDPIITSVNGQTGDVVLTKSDVGLSNVDNTSDLDKPISTATQDALDLKQDTLISTTNIKSINGQSILGSGDLVISGGGAVNSVNSQIGHVVLTKSDIGLSDVDNTSDLDKPISTAVQNVLDTKYDISNPEGYITLSDISTALVTSVDGQTGDITLNNKVNVVGDTMTGQLTMIDSPIVVDNTITQGFQTITELNVDSILLLTNNGTDSKELNQSSSTSTLNRTNIASTTSDANIVLSVEQGAPYLIAQTTDYVNNTLSQTTLGTQNIVLENTDNITGNLYTGILGTGAYSIQTTLADGSYVLIEGTNEGTAATQYDGVNTTPLMPVLPEHYTVKAYVDSLIGPSLIVKDEGTDITTSAVSLNFTGTGVISSSDPSGNVTISVSAASDATALIVEAYNQIGSTIPKMAVVYINGAHGNLPNLALSQANTEATSSKTVGIVRSDISNMSNGFVVATGRLEDLDTDIVGWNEGDSLWLSPTIAGGITNIKPTAPDHTVFLGTLIRKHPTQGVIEVKIQNGFEIQELHNVLISSLLPDQILKYDSVTSLWKNHTLTKSDVGLSNVDNTSDVNKPISNATQTALNGKENTITAGTTSQYYRGDKTFQTLDKSAVGLSNVDNTSDANKPISSATQTALNTKVETSSNLGGGSGIFSAKVGTNLQFKSLVAGTNVTLSSDANTITINSSGGGGGGSGFLSNLVTISSSPYTITSPTEDGYLFLADTSSIALTINLPTTASSGFKIVIKDHKGNSSAKNITVTKSASHTIEQLNSSYVCESNFGSWTFVFDGTSNWVLI